MSAQSRRAILGALAAIPVEAPRRPWPFRSSLNSGLYARFQEARAAWLDFASTYRKAADKSQAAMQANRHRLTQGQRREGNEGCFKVWREVCGEWDGAIGHGSELKTEVDRIAEQIMKAPARTPADFAVKAEVLVWVFGTESWDEPPEQMDYDQEMLRRFVEALQVAAGLTNRGHAVRFLTRLQILVGLALVRSAVARLDAQLGARYSSR